MGTIILIIVLAVWGFMSSGGSYNNGESRKYSDRGFQDGVRDALRDDFFRR